MRYLKIFLISLILATVTISVSSAQEIQVLDRTPFAYQRLGVTTAAVRQLDSTYRNQATAIFVTVETNNIRYRIDGGDPSITEGHLVVAGLYQNIYIVDPSSIRNLRMIGIGGTSIVTVTYYR